MLHRDFHVPHARHMIRKGHPEYVGSYSAFLEADRSTPTGLAGYLRDVGAKRVWVASFATDSCVAWTALDGRAAGFGVVVIEEACRAIDLNGSLEKAWQNMRKAGVQSDDVLKTAMV